MYKKQTKSMNDEEHICNSFSKDSVKFTHQGFVLLIPP